MEILEAVAISVVANFIVRGIIWFCTEDKKDD